ncbi:MAG: tRNA lysidine(34) synthetase TilS [Coriobacteriales bacterium]
MREADKLTSVAQDALDCIAEHGLAAPGGAPLVLMVSGGSDSTAMTLVALELAEAGLLDPSRVTVLHVNHHLRGDDADGDARFVRRLAGLCGFACTVADIDIPAHLSEFDGNVESAGRHLRYQEAQSLLDKACDACGCPRYDGRIWVAHTEDDRVETFLMRAIVGTGPGGLAGMDYCNGRIVRPLMHASREGLRAYILEQVEARGWEIDGPQDAQVSRGCWREDRTNSEDEGFRAFVRNRIVPLAEERNPALGPTMGRMLDLLLEENAMVGRQVAELREHAACEVDGCTLIDARMLAEVPVPLATRLVHEVCKEHLPVAKRIESQHVLEIVRRAGDPAFSMDVPGGVSAWHEFGNLAIGPRGAIAPVFEPVELGVPGEAELPYGLVLRVEIGMLPGGAFQEFAADKLSEVVDADALGERLTVGGPVAGERMCPFGMGGSHKLVADVLAEAKISRRHRAVVPIVRSGDRVVWVAGVRLDERFRVTPQTKRIARLTIE